MIPFSEIDLMDEKWWHLMPPPEWAQGVAEGLEVGAQLPTKDGRRCGNAHIVHESIGVHPGGHATLHQFRVLTDAGTELTLTPDEIEELFHPPTYVSDVRRIREKFGDGPKAKLTEGQLSLAEALHDSVSVPITEVNRGTLELEREIAKQLTEVILEVK